MLQAHRAERANFASPPQSQTRFGLTQEQRRTGKMLGVLLCSEGTVLRAFSGMLGVLAAAGRRRARRRSQ